MYIGRLPANYETINRRYCYYQSYAANLKKKQTKMLANDVIALYLYEIEISSLLSWIAIF